MRFLVLILVTGCITRTIVQPAPPVPPINYAVRFVEAVSPDATVLAFGADTAFVREGDALAICFAEKHKTQCHTLADWGANPPRTAQPPAPVLESAKPESIKADPPRPEAKKLDKR